MKTICEWENCKNPGDYKAPLEKDNSKKYKLLCLKHIKLFNKSWNYFNNMTQDEVEYFIKSDVTWHKPTKKFGSSDNFFQVLWNNALNDKLNIFNNSDYKSFKNRKLSQKDKDAYEVLEINYEAKWPEIQKKFKDLVKKYHPDKNQGNNKFENKLKKVTLAYSQLKKSMDRKQR